MDNMAVIQMLLFLLVITACVHGQTVKLNGYEKWTTLPSGRDDMFCPTDCITSEEGYERCCSCKARPCWELVSDPSTCGVSVGYLKLEFIDMFGTAIVIDTSVGATDILVLEQPHGYLTELPTNICDFNATLRKVDLSFNRLQNVDAVKCLKKLDTLLLNDNFITNITNTTFSEMESLRVISFANNLIGVLGPNTISVPNENIFYVDFSNNKLKETDVTNAFREGPFCELNYDNCDLGNITNINDFKIDVNKTYGPGDTYANNTNLGQFFDLTMMGVTDYTSLGRFLKGQIHIDSSSIYCDCSIYPLFVGFGKDGLYKYWPNIGDPNGIEFICQGPEHMVNVKIKDFFEAGNWSQLTCNIDVDCSEGCYCTEIPGEKLITVDCSDRSLDHFPERLPTGRFNIENVKLLLDNNSISEIGDKPYLPRIRHLQMTNNTVTSFNDFALTQIKNITIIIPEQQLSKLPKQLYNKDPNKIVFGESPVDCSCENLWIGRWIRVYDARGRLRCKVDGQIIPAENATDISLNCLEAEKYSMDLIVIVIAVFLIVLISTFIALRFKTEILLLKRRLTNSLDKSGQTVFVSMCDENEDVFAFVHYCVRPALRHIQAKVYVPWFDFVYGGNLEEEISKSISESDVFVVFLCYMYLHNSKSVTEFDSIWKSFLSNKHKQLLIVNWDGIDTDDIHDWRLKALCRTGYSIEFDHNNERFMRRIAKRALPERNASGIPYQYTTYPGGSEPMMNRPVGIDPNNQDEMDDVRDGTCETADEETELKTLPLKAPPITNVFERLTQVDSKGVCNCKYRKCYVHMFHTDNLSFYTQSQCKFC